MLCPKCHKLNPAASKFCASCGNALSVSSGSLIQVGDLFRNTWDFYWRCWQNLLLVSLITIVVWKIWRMVVVPALVVSFGLGALATRNFSSGIGVGLLGLATLILTWLVVFEVGFWGSAAMIIALEKTNKGISLKISDIYREAKKFLWPLSVVSLWVFLVVFWGFIFLIIPGIILIFLLQFTNFVVVVEGKTGFGALKRSMSLIGNNFLGILGRNLLMGLIIFLVNIIFGKMLFFSIVSQTLILPFALVYHYLVYKSTVVREVAHVVPLVSS